MNVSSLLPNLLPKDSADPSEPDARPRFAIGHLALSAADITGLVDFYERIGMRIVVASDHFGILELRGGTHVVLQSGPAGHGELDLIVDDIDEAHEILAAAGAECGPISRGRPHDRFVSSDPEGNRLFVSSNHAIGPV